jgi:beta-lactamase family protein
MDGPSRDVRLALLAFAAAAFIACGGSDGASGTSPDRAPDATALPPDAATYFPGSAWRTAAPEQVGIPGSVLARVGERLASRAWGGLDSFIVIRRGYLVHESYYGASSRDDVHTLQSVSKSVTSLVTGIAADMGAVDPDATVLSVLPRYADASSDPRLPRVTLRHLLQMRSGINFYEYPYPGSPLETLNNSRGDWVRIALEQPFNAEPGALWQYNSGGVIALGHRLEQRLVRRHGRLRRARADSRALTLTAARYSTPSVAVITWVAPGASVSACSPTFAVSTHSIRGHSSSPKSGIARAFATHGFQSTVVAEPVFAIVTRRPQPGSSIVTVAVVSR